MMMPIHSKVFTNQSVILESRPQMVKNPYSQMSSAFKLGMQDRFGENKDAMS